MKPIVAIAAGLLLTTAAMSDVKVEVNIGGNTERECGYDNASYNDDDNDGDDDSWYEDYTCRGPNEESIEYQWSNSNGRPILRYRTVVYFTTGSSWSFGPWQMRNDYCRPGCSFHHRHNFYVIRHERFDRHPHYYKHKNNRCEVVREYRYEKHPRLYKNKDYDYDRDYRNDSHDQYRHNEPSYNKPQEPVRRPSVRPVPGSFRTSTEMQPVQQANNTTTYDRGLQKHGKVYRIDN